MGNLISLISGIIFGLGLAVSGMINPAKVIGFLDVTGAWDPSLAFVMGGAVLVTATTFRFILRRRQPVLDRIAAIYPVFFLLPWTDCPPPQQSEQTLPRSPVKWG